MVSFYSSLKPRRLTTQIILLLLATLFGSLLIAILFLRDEQRNALLDLDRNQVFERTVTAVGLLELENPKRATTRLLRALESGRLDLKLSDAPLLAKNENDFVTERLADELRWRLGDDAPRDMRARMRERSFFFQNFNNDDDDEHLWKKDRDGDDHRFLDRKRRDHPHPSKGYSRSFKDHDFGRRSIDIAISIQLRDGRWLNVDSALLPQRSPYRINGLGLLLGMGFTLIIVVVFSVRRILRPLQDLAEASDRLGRGEAIEPLKVAGPLEVRRTTSAFNAMQQRLDRFVRSRTQMLAAISHDLRTPITALRLRSEFIDDEDLRTRLQETLDEMQQMVEATLTFARQETQREKTQNTDLAALIDAICEDIKDLGGTANYEGPDRFLFLCRPVAMKRALSNLMTNAAKYGETAEVNLIESRGQVMVTIADKGPGIHEDKMEQVFQPFVRLEESRNQETGGVGLGLSIARSIIQAHGGDITLTNRPEGGLEVSVSLPKPRKN